MDPGFASTASRLLAIWAETWARPALASGLAIEVSPRLHRALGRAYPARRLVRIASHVVATAPPAALAEILCHEVAHVAVFDVHGRSARPHGREWAALVRAAGFEPHVRANVARLGIALPAVSAATAARRRRYLYEHRCPVCRAARMARRVVRRWRCAACLAAGLGGELDVYRRASAPRSGSG